MKPTVPKFVLCVEFLQFIPSLTLATWPSLALVSLPVTFSQKSANSRFLFNYRVRFVILDPALESKSAYIRSLSALHLRLDRVRWKELFSVKIFGSFGWKNVTTFYELFSPHLITPVPRRECLLWDVRTFEERGDQTFISISSTRGRSIQPRAGLNVDASKDYTKLHPGGRVWTEPTLPTTTKRVPAAFKTRLTSRAATSSLWVCFSLHYLCIKLV